jgi:hypothetical protein
MNKSIVVLVGLLALVLVSVAGAAAPTNASPGATPFAACTADQAALQQSLGSTLYPGSEIEPRSAINPTNPNNIIGVYQQDRWSDGGSRGTVASVTHNGGSSWTRVVVSGVSACSGNLAFARATDPWVTFSPDGTAWQFTFSFDAFSQSNAMFVSKSTNGGDTWGAPIALIDERSPADPKRQFTGGNDKNSITADPTDSRYVYAVWDRYQSPPSERAVDIARIRAASYEQPALLSRTTDGGATWSTPREILDSGTHAGTIGNVIAVTSSGVVLDGTMIFSDNAQRKLPYWGVAVVRSTDKGATWSKKPIIVATANPADPGPVDPGTGQPVRAGFFDFATGPNNTAYAVWTDDSLTPGIESILYSQSSDGGLTWSQPFAVNKTPRNIPALDQQAFTPTVTVTSAGVVGISYYDFRANAPNLGSKTDMWLVRCPNACTRPASWSEVRVTPTSFDMSAAPFARGEFLGDYMGMTTSGTTFQPFFIQSGTPPAADGPADAFFTTIP